MGELLSERLTYALPEDLQVKVVVQELVGSLFDVAQPVIDLLRYCGERAVVSSCDHNTRFFEDVYDLVRESIFP